MLNEPLSPNEARKLLSRIVATGWIDFPTHARAEMANDSIDLQMARDVLRRGHIHEPAELQGRNPTWRYRVHLNNICVVILFREETSTVVVTAWRKR